MMAVATVGQLIVARLAELKKRQRDLVRELDRVGAAVTKQSVNAWIRGNARPQMHHLLALWDVLAIAPEARQPWMDALAAADRAAADRAAATRRDNAAESDAA